MLWWMLRVDNWLDVVSLENMEEDHSFLFLKKNLMKIFFFFLKNLEILNFCFMIFFFFWRNWKFWLIIFFYWKFWKSWIFSKNWKFWLIFFIFGKQPKKYEPNAPSPNALFENLLFFFFFLKYEDFFIIKKWKRWR